MGISYGQSKSLMVCTDSSDCIVLSYMRTILVVCMSIYSFVVLMFMKVILQITCHYII